MLETKFLKDNVENIQKLMTLPPLKKFETESLCRLVRLSKIRKYEAGEVIIREGDTDRWLYFLLSGRVRVEKDGLPVVIIDKEGAIFGEMSILDGLKRSASVNAVTPTTCLAVDTSATDRLASEDERANFLLLLYRVTTEFISLRLRTTTDELIRVKREQNTGPAAQLFSSAIQ